MHYLYLYENKINGKVYVGQTRDLSARHAEHKYNAKHINNRFHNALNKYGIDNFDYSVILAVETQEQIDQEEIFWISTMRECLGKSNVYNLRDGGSRGKNTPEIIANIKKALSDPEVRDKIRQSKLGKKRKPFTKAPVTEETKLKMSEAAKKRVKNSIRKSNGRF